MKYDAKDINTLRPRENLDALAQAVSHHAASAKLEAADRWDTVLAVAEHPDLVGWIRYFLQADLPSDPNVQRGIALLIAQAMLRQHEYTEKKWLSVVAHQEVTTP